MDLNIIKLNEVYIKIECERNIAQELYEFFSFYVPNYKFIPSFRNKMWDGKIHLFDLKSNNLYIGLLPYVKVFCDEREYLYNVDKLLNVEPIFDNDNVIPYVESLGLPFKPRDYQIQSFIQAINNKRLLLLSPTASGKSLIIYLIIRYLQAINMKRGLLIVPNTNLVMQMFRDFQDYGYNSDEYCHNIQGGIEKDSDKFLFISTWQSIYKQPKEYFQQFDFVITDEAHTAKAESIKSIMSKCTNASYRYGTTGTLDDSLTHKLVLEGLFGKVYQSTTTAEMIENNQCANFDIKCLVLKHHEAICKESKHWTYQNEIDYIVDNTKRNNFIKNLTLKLTGNTLVLFKLQKHGKHIHDIISHCAEQNRHVFFVYGGTDTEIRDSVRDITERENNAIIIASYGVYSTGVNIRNLHNIIFAAPSKSRIRVLQSIGRGLRLGNNKQKATLYDIADDLRYKKGRSNYTLNHYIERLSMYDAEQHNYKQYVIDMN